MATEEDVKRLKRGVAEWNKWRGKNPGYRPDFSGASLKNIYLVGANLTGANFKNANLKGANFTDADLTEADLTGTNLTGADLTGADINGTNFNGANLTRIQSHQNKDSLYVEQ